jgi:hypothetical protein
MRDTLWMEQGGIWVARRRPSYRHVILVIVIIRHSISLVTDSLNRDIQPPPLLLGGGVTLWGGGEVLHPTRLTFNSFTRLTFGLISQHNAGRDSSGCDPSACRRCDPSACRRCDPSTCRRCDPSACRRCDPSACRRGWMCPRAWCGIDFVFVEFRPKHACDLSN